MRCLLRHPTHEYNQNGNGIGYSVGEDRGPQVAAGEEVDAAEHQAGVGGIHHAGGTFVEVSEAKEHGDAEHRGHVGERVATVSDLLTVGPSYHRRPPCGTCGPPMLPT